jgi:topoisomerase-4 subunit B
MASATRTLLRVTMADLGTEALVESLMGRKPELRYAYITENARFARDLDI